MHMPVTARFPNHAFNENIYNEGVHLALPPHFFSIQVKSGACYITGQWVASSKQNKRNLIPTLTLTPKPNYLLLFFIIKFVSLSWFLQLHHFYGLFMAYLLYEEVMSVRLYMYCFHEWDVFQIHLFYDTQKLKNTCLLSLEKKRNFCLHDFR